MAAALLHALDGLPVHALGLPSLLSDPGARSLEEAVVHAVVEARRAAPAILFLPHLQVRRDLPQALRLKEWGAGAVNVEGGACLACSVAQ